MIKISKIRLYGSIETGKKHRFSTVNSWVSIEHAEFCRFTHKIGDENDIYTRVFYTSTPFYIP